MRKLILLVLGLLVLVVVGLYFSLQQNPLSTHQGGSVCRTLPIYVNEFQTYYEKVEINNNSCYPGFSFLTPLNYSSFGVHYKVANYLGDYYKLALRANTTENTLQEYDKQIRQRIKITENCPDFKKFIEVTPYTEIPIDYLGLNYPALDNRKDPCQSMSLDTETEETKKAIRDFLASQNNFGNYTSCGWVQISGGESAGWEWSGSKNSGEIQFYAICDGVKEGIKLVIQNDTIIKGYFQNSFSESYRQIYPEDIFLTERKPRWE